MNPNSRHDPERDDGRQGLSRRGFVGWVASIGAGAAALLSSCFAHTRTTRSVQPTPHPEPPRSSTWSHTFTGPFTFNTKIPIAGAAPCAFATPMDLEVMDRPNWAALMLRYRFEGAQDPNRYIRVDLTLFDANGAVLTMASRITEDERIFAANPPPIVVSGRTPIFRSVNLETFDVSAGVYEALNKITIEFTETF